MWQSNSTWVDVSEAKILAFLAIGNMQTSYYQRSKISFTNVPWFHRFSLVEDLRKFSIFYLFTFIRQWTPTPTESLEYKLYKLASLREIFSKEFQALLCAWERAGSWWKNYRNEGSIFNLTVYAQKAKIIWTVGHFVSLVQVIGWIRKFKMARKIMLQKLF